MCARPVLCVGIQHKYLPCILCIPIDGILDRNNSGIESEIARREYAVDEAINANSSAALPPNISPNLP